MSSVPSTPDDSSRLDPAERSASGPRLMGRARAALDRDAALARIRRVRGWTIVAAAALSAGLTGLVSAIAPGKSLGAAKHLTTSVARRAHPHYMKTPLPALPPLASAASLGLVPPGSPPGSSSSAASAAATATAQQEAAQQAAQQQAAAQQAAQQQAAQQQASGQGMTAQGGGGVVSGGS
jgi:hypothetical protein